MRRQIVVGSLLALALGAAAQAGEKEDVAAGHDLAVQTCTACHQVAAQQPQAPKLATPAPSFVSIANSPGVTADAVYEFLMSKHQSKKTPPDMPTMILTEREAQVLTAYIMDLRKAP